MGKRGGGGQERTKKFSTNPSSKRSICRASASPTHCGLTWNPPRSRSGNSTLFITAIQIGTVFDSESGNLFPRLVESTITTLHHHPLPPRFSQLCLGRRMGGVTLPAMLRNNVQHAKVQPAQRKLPLASVSIGALEVHPTPTATSTWDVPVPRPSIRHQRETKRVRDALDKERVPVD